MDCASRKSKRGISLISLLNWQRRTTAVDPHLISNTELHEAVSSEGSFPMIQKGKVNNF